MEDKNKQDFPDSKINDRFKEKIVLRLAQGENPYQIPADLFTSDNQDVLSLHKLQALTNAVPCYTNLADIDCVLYTLCLAAEAFRLRCKRIPYIAIAAKHGNPCGMAVNWESSEKVILRALFGNPLAVWGGEFIVNFKISEDLARLLYKSQKRKEMFDNAYWMLDVVVAPDFDKKTIGIIGKSVSRKLLKNPELYKPKLARLIWQYRQIRGGFLRQPPPSYMLDFTKTEGTVGQLEDKTLDSLTLAWSVVYSSNHGGNEIALVKDNQLLGVGGGPSTIDAAKTAVSRAKDRGHDIADSVFAADAFFPFVDAPEVLKKAGCRYGIVPSGGKNEALVKKYFQDNNISVVYIPSQYRGFCRH